MYSVLCLITSLAIPDRHRDLSVLSSVQSRVGSAQILVQLLTVYLFRYYTGQV